MPLGPIPFPSRPVPRVQTGAENLFQSLGPAFRTFYEAYMQGKSQAEEQKRYEAQAQRQKEHDALEMEALNLRLNELKTRAKTEEFDTKLKEFKALEGINPPDTEAQVMGPTGDPMGPAMQIPGRHPKVDIPGLGPQRPRSLREVLAQAVAQQEGLSRAKALEHQVQVEGPAAEALGVGPGSYDNRILGNIRPKEMVDLPPDMASTLGLSGGAQPRSSVDVATKIFEQNQANARTDKTVEAKSEPLVPVQGPEGTIYVPRSEAAGQKVPPRETTGSAAGKEKLIEATAQRDNIATLLKNLKPEHVGIGASAMSALEENVPFVPVDEAKAASRAGLAGVANNVAKFISGTAVSGAEEKRLKSYIPKGTDKYTIVRVKMKNLIREMDTILKVRAAMGQGKGNDPLDILGPQGIPK